MNGRRIIIGFLIMMFGIVAGIVGLGVIIFRGTFHDDVYTQDKRIRKDMGTLERIYNVSFPESTQFHFRKSWGGLREAAEHLKISINESDLPSFVSSIRIEEQRELKEPWLSLRGDNSHTLWECKKANTARVIGAPVGKPHLREISISHPANHQVTVYLVWIEPID